MERYAWGLVEMAVTVKPYQNQRAFDGIKDIAADGVDAHAETTKSQIYGGGNNLKGELTMGGYTRNKLSVEELAKIMKDNCLESLEVETEHGIVSVVLFKKDE